MLLSKKIFVTIVGVLALTSGRLVHGEVRNWLLSYLSTIRCEHIAVAIDIGIGIAAVAVAVARSEKRLRTLFLFTYTHAPNLSGFCLFVCSFVCSVCA